jgi:Zn-dependent protease with chaperone function
MSSSLMASRQADRPLWWLVALLLLLTALATLAGRSSDDLYLQIANFCERSWREITEHAWLGGMASLPLILLVSLGRGLHTAVRVARSTQKWVAELGPTSLANGRLGRIAQEVGLEGRVHLVWENRLLALTTGIFRPRVLVSTGLVALLNDAELRAVLAHERHHVTHRDPLKVWLIYALANALFFLPLARDLREVYLVRKELAADRDAIRLPGQKRDLASALLKMLDAGASPALSPLAVGPFSPAQARLAQLTGEGVSLVGVSRRRLIQSFVVGLALLILVAALLVEPTHAAKMAQCEPTMPFTRIPG